MDDELSNIERLIRDVVDCTTRTKGGVVGQSNDVKSAILTAVARIKNTFVLTVITSPSAEEAVRFVEFHQQILISHFQLRLDLKAVVPSNKKQKLSAIATGTDRELRSRIRDWRSNDETRTLCLQIPHDTHSGRTNVQSHEINKTKIVA